MYPESQSSSIPAHAVALCPLEAMFAGNGTAFADGSPLPRRWVMTFMGNGINVSGWNPTATGAGYHVLDASGAVFGFGDASTWASAVDPDGDGRAEDPPVRVPEVTAVALVVHHAPPAVPAVPGAARHR